MRQKHGFGIFFDPTKTTSGQRFFKDLCDALSQESVPLADLPAVVLFNVSAPWREILRAKWNRQTVVLRVDGLYCDRLSPQFIATFGWAIRTILSIGLKLHWTHDYLANFANFINQNYGAFLRIMVANHVIYQSEFSKKLHHYYFPNKSYSVIVNGSAIRVDEDSKQHNNRVIRLVTIYDDWRPAKRMQDIVSFVKWANQFRDASINLTIIGYTGIVPFEAPVDMKVTIETNSHIQVLPRFNTFTNELSNIMMEGDLYVTFSFRDACPNVVVEAMAHGLPVVGVGSGGIPDIVGNAGVLITVNDFASGLFAAQRYEYDFPPIDFEAVLQNMQYVLANYTHYKSATRERFKTELSINVVAEKYASVLRRLVSECQRGKVIP